MNIYIPIEVKARELEGRSLLAFVAAERGHTVILGEKNNTIVLAQKGQLPSGIIHMKSITPHEPMMNMLTSFHKHGHKITVQDEESGLADHSYETFAKLRFSEKSLSYTSRVFAWGDFDGSSLKEMYPDYADKIVITGSPRVDFWTKSLDKYFESFSDDELLSEKPYILVVANFGSFLNENRLWNVLARLREAGYFDREQDRELYEYENAAYRTRLIGKFVEMARELAATHPDHNIIVRPHPSESVEGWEKIIGEFPNIIVKREGTISKWIRHSKMIIHNGCLSAFEAATSGTLRIAYRPLPNELERAIPNLLSFNVYSLDELKQVVSDFLEDRKTDNFEEVQQRTRKFLNSRLKNWEGELAADSIVDEWEAIGNDSSFHQSDVSELKRILKNQKPTLKRRLKRTAVKMRNSVLGYNTGKKGSKRLLKSHHKFPDFKEEEMEEQLKKLRSSLDRFHNVSYHRYGEKSFVLTGKQ